MLVACRQIVESHGDNVNALLDVGALLLDFGFLTRARECFERVRVLAPNDLRPVVNLANLARDAGNHAESRRLYSALQASQPNTRSFAAITRQSGIRPAVSDSERLQDACGWGKWPLRKRVAHVRAHRFVHWMFVLARRLRLC